MQTLNRSYTLYYTALGIHPTVEDKVCVVCGVCVCVCERVRACVRVRVCVGVRARELIGQACMRK